MPKVGELILLAAPSCCGKTHFLGELFAGRLHHVSTAMKIETPINSYQSVIPKEIADIDSSHVPGMILHYALPTIALNDGSLRNLEDDPRLEIANPDDLGQSIKNYDEVALTLKATQYEKFLDPQ